MVNMMRANGCTAGVDNFEDLGALKQLTGRSVSGHTDATGTTAPRATIWCSWPRIWSATKTCSSS